MTKRSISSLLLVTILAVMMVVSLIPAGAITVTVDAIPDVDRDLNLDEVALNTGNPAIDASVAVGQPGNGYTPTGTAINSAAEFDAMEPDGAYYLAANITVSKTYKGFNGVFDGNGHTVTTTVPLFLAPQSATIKNLTVAGTISTGTSVTDTGAVACGTAASCNFFNILNKASVSSATTLQGSDTSFNNKYRAAGIAGRTGGNTIFERCTNTGTISGGDLAGGITELVSADNLSTAVFINCKNTGAITSQNNAGGIVANVDTKNDRKVYFVDCRNEGKVTAEYSAGGIAGWGRVTSNIHMVNSTNAGAIVSVVTTLPSGEYKFGAGGMLGFSSGKLVIDSCVNEKNGTVTIGASNSSAQTNAGGIIGRYREGEVLIVDCVNNAAIEGGGQSGGIAGWLYTAKLTVKGCTNNGSVSSRKNYAGGIASRVSLDDHVVDVDVQLLDCVNTGKVTSFKNNGGGIIGYCKTTVYISGCRNTGTITYRSDATDGLVVGGIAGTVDIAPTIIDCRNEGTVTGKPNAAGSGTNNRAGGIIGSAGSSNGFGPSRIYRCTNIGNVTMERNSDTTKTPGAGTCFAGGIVGYQFGSKLSQYADIRYCVNMGNVTGATEASLLLGYTNSTHGYFFGNILCGTAKSLIYTSGLNGSGSSVINAICWNQGETLAPDNYSENYVVEGFTGKVLNNIAKTGAGTPIAFDSKYAYKIAKATTEAQAIAKRDALIAQYENSTPIEISTADQLATISAEGSYKLTADITVPGTLDIAFAGVLDGNGHTLTLSAPLFTSTTYRARIHDLTLAGDITVEGTLGGADSPAAALAITGGGQIVNVTNNANVTANNGFASGIIARLAYAAVFENCVNNGSINAQGYRLDGSKRYYSCAGGIVAYTNLGFARFINCENNGSINAPKHAGGIVGESQVSGTYIDGCKNTGSISSAGATESGDVKVIGAGGILGYNGSNRVTVLNSFNSGNISGMVSAGILGDACKGAFIKYCVNTGEVVGNGSGVGGIYNKHEDLALHYVVEAVACINTGKITGSDAKTAVGGIAGIAARNGIGKSKTADNIIYEYLFESCINVGEVSGYAANKVGAIAGFVDTCDTYTAATADATGTLRLAAVVKNCIAAGSIMNHSGSCSGLIGQITDVGLSTFTNNLIVPALQPTTKSFTYYGTSASAFGAAANISDNVCLADVAGYDVYVKLAAADADVKAFNSYGTSTVIAPSLAFGQSEISKQMMVFVGIDKFDGAYSYLFEGDTVENKVGVYDAAGKEIAIVDDIHMLPYIMKDGYTVKLLANYYSVGIVDLDFGNLNWNFDGNGYAFYLGKVGSPIFHVIGKEKAVINMKNLIVYSEVGAILIGNNNIPAEFTVNLENVQAYGGSRNHLGYFKPVVGQGIKVEGTKTMVKITGENTKVLNYQYGALDIYAGLEVTAGTFDSVVSSVVYIANSKAGMPVILSGGTYNTNANVILVTEVAVDRDLLVTGGTYNSNGESNVISLGSNNTATTNITITGGTLNQNTAGSSSLSSAGKANVIFMHPTFVGTLKITGGTFTGNNQGIRTSALDATILVEGGTFETGAESIHVNPDATPVITLNGGTFNAKSGAAVSVVAATAEQTKKALTLGAVTLKSTATAVAVGANRSYDVAVNGATLDAPLALDLACKGTLKITDVTVNTAGNAFKVGALSSIEILDADITLTGTGTVFTFTGNIPAMTISGGSFKSTGKGEALFNFSNSSTAVINITGGYFETNGKYLVKITGGQLSIQGGVFVLAAGETSVDAAAILVGDSAGKATLVLKSGIFVNQRPVAGQIISKGNASSTINLIGASMMASKETVYFVKSVTAAENVLTSGANGLTADYAGAEYTFWMINAADNSAYEIVTTKGAQARTHRDSTGIRFISKIEAAKITAAKTLAGTNGTVSFGTVIAPIDYVAKVSEFTMAALDASTDSFFTGKTRYLNLAAAAGYHEDAAGNVEIRAALVNIKESNLDRGFAAIAYVKVTDGAGVETYFYGAFDTMENVRSIKEVASVALADVKDAAEGDYVFITADGRYSKYSDAEREALGKYVAPAA